MSKGSKQKVVLTFNINHLINSHGKKETGSSILFFENGDVGYGSYRDSLFGQKYKVKRLLPASEISKVELSTSAGDDTTMTVKISDTNGNVDVVRALILLKSRRNFYASQAPAILSALYKDRYSKL